MRLSQLLLDRDSGRTYHQRMAAARVDPTARQIQAFATYCGAGSRKAAAQANELFGRRKLAGRFGAARTLGRLLTPVSWRSRGPNSVADGQPPEAGEPLL